MEKKITVLICILICLAPWAKAQGTVDIFDKDVPITWLGLDFTHAKFVGDRDKLTKDGKGSNLLTAWNDLLNKEADKYNVKDAFQKKTVTPDFGPAIKNNSELDFNSIIVDQPIAGFSLDNESVQTIVKDYDFGSLQGVGLLFVVESFSKIDNKATIWITFINIDSKEVVFTQPLTAPPGGIGVRNFWGGAIAVIIRNIKKTEFAKWSKEKKEVTLAEVKSTPAPKVAASNKTQSVSNKREVAGTEETKADKEPVAKAIKPGGQYFALLIGVSKYTDTRLNLDHPVNDAKKMKETLGQFYDFAPGNIILLENPTRSDIFSALYKLRTKVTANDNLLIFYAGHGFWDEKIKQGYWWPKDATTADPSNWLSNSDLREQLRGINSAHTLLVSDACFSGGIFRTRDASAIKSASIDYQMLYKMPSRRAMTSGTLTAVPDRSVFVEYLVKRLAQNQEKFLPSQALFNSIRLAIINNSATVPQEGVIAETGDEGGDFIFMKK